MVRRKSTPAWSALALLLGCGDAPVQEPATVTTTDRDEGPTTSSVEGGSVGVTSSPEGGSTGDMGGTSRAPSTGTSDATGADPLQDAIERGIEGTVALADENIVLSLLMDVMHRRFAIGDFAMAAAQYDATIAAQPDAPIDAYAFRRIFDPGQVLTAQELEAIAPGVNRVTVPALFCDTLQLPDDYADRLVSEAAQGGYGITHVALALHWMGELGCTYPLDASFTQQIIVDTFALIDTRDGLDDLELEAALFGTLLDGPELLPVDLVDTIIAGQLPDGTWPHDPGGLTGAWHTTGLALFVLLELNRDPLDAFLATG